MTYHFAETIDIELLAQLNEQLIQDEGHRSRLSARELEPFIRRWLQEGYRAVLFEEDREVVAYALYRPEETCHDNEEGIYLRQFLVRREFRGRGMGREAFRLLEEKIWPRGCRITVDVLVSNGRALEFWKSAGFRDYAMILERNTAGRN